VIHQEWNVPQRRELRRIKQRMREVKMKELKQGRCKEAVKNSSACINRHSSTRSP
jgi:hypothetical protein